MMKYIFLKELQSYLLNRSMVFTWALIIVLFLLNASISVFYYRDLQNKHAAAVIQNSQTLEFDATGAGYVKEMMSIYTGQPYEKINALPEITRLSQAIANPPSPLVFMSTTSSGLVPDGVTMNYFTEPEFASLTGYNPYINPYLSIDWTTVMIYIISFLCICFSYNAFSGEKEDGTLKLILANSISRSSIIIAKLLGLLTVFVIPLLLGIILCCIVFELSSTFPTGMAEYAKIAYFFGASVLVICVTALMGFLISALSQKSYISLILCLVCWTLMVIVIPNISWIISRQIDKIPPESNIQQEERQQINDLEDCFMGWQGNNTPYEKVLARKECADRRTNVHNSLWSDYHNMQFEQTRKAIGISKMSPFGLFRFLGDNISGNNYYGYLSFFEQVKNYQLTFCDYIVSKDRADPESRHLIWNDGGLGIEYMSQQNVIPSETPKFSGQSASFRQILANSLGDIVILCLWVIGLFVLLYIAFIKYDVR
jgi:ABC-type transport system involved in multi-copper enzyme maturation permease subunit